MREQAPILFGILRDLVWIRVRGRGSFQISPHLKRFAGHEISAGRRRFVVDLEECQHMDSTFMGTLLGIATQLAGVDGTLAVVNANDRNRTLMRNLGLDLLIDIDLDGSRWGEERRLVNEELTAMDTVRTVDRQETATVVLEAHEALAGLREENRPRFRDVIDYLKDELEPR